MSVKSYVLSPRTHLGRKIVTFFKIRVVFSPWLERILPDMCGFLHQIRVLTLFAEKVAYSILALKSSQKDNCEGDFA